MSFQKEVQKEFMSAYNKHPMLNSVHEGLAVLWEEFEEVKQEVFKRNLDRTALRKELIQVAAMAQRMAEDCK